MSSPIVPKTLTREQYTSQTVTNDRATQYLGDRLTERPIKLCVRQPRRTQRHCSLTNVVTSTVDDDDDDDDDSRHNESSNDSCSDEDNRVVDDSNIRIVESIDYARVERFAIAVLRCVRRRRKIVAKQRDESGRFRTNDDDMLDDDGRPVMSTLGDLVATVIELWQRFALNDSENRTVRALLRQHVGDFLRDNANDVYRYGGRQQRTDRATCFDVARLLDACAVYKAPLSVISETDGSCGTNDYDDDDTEQQELVDATTFTTSTTTELGTVNAALLHNAAPEQQRYQQTRPQQSQQWLPQPQQFASSLLPRVTRLLVDATNTNIRMASRERRERPFFLAFANNVVLTHARRAHLRERSHHMVTRDNANRRHLVDLPVIHRNDAEARHRFLLRPVNNAMILPLLEEDGSGENEERPSFPMAEEGQQRPIKTTSRPIANDKRVADLLRSKILNAYGRWAIVEPKLFDCRIDRV